MSDHGYKFYMQECNKDGVLVDETKKDLEVDFDGLKYAKCEGLNDYGKPKNVYIETHAISNKVNAHVPKSITHESTKIKFTFYFTGENRQKTYYDFVDYVRNGYHQYWDTARKRVFVFCVVDEIKPAKEMMYGNTPYLELNFTVQNLKGHTDEFIEETE